MMYATVGDLQKRVKKKYSQKKKKKCMQLFWKMLQFL